MPDSYSDFVAQMQVAVREETALWELPSGSTVLLPSGNVVHGPWPARECSDVMTSWLRRNWIELYLPSLPNKWNLPGAEWRVRASFTERFLLLANVDAEKLLRDPSRWTLDSEDGHVALSLTSSGADVDDREWLAAAVQERH
ncbi:hypothetical protein [Frondihabitans sp. PAMC 28766]|uniref:hypothetical protein n=1 Tax=Frondihabitans sp. PAMC 28766 TaxID=1795630 RepID=UPI0012FF6282|nr:hypothetical protein [Frondihabitans sp. PAMC 28766]